MLSPLFIICIKIFFCRILDVSLSTLRTIIVVKGKPLLSSIIGFCEVLIWFLIVREALLFDMAGSELIVAVSYAGGFASGTFIGGMIARKFIDSNVTVEVVTSSKDDNIIQEIRAAGFAITILDVNSSVFGRKKYMIFAEIKNSQLKEFKDLIYSLDKKAFIMAQETKYVYNGFKKR